VLLTIQNSPRDYAWGRRGAISRLLGRPATDEVEAELWLGTHHGSPARVTGDGRSLADIAPELPFLLKVLAAGSPLSLQAHPDAEQAREGFERENAAGVALDASERNYKDPFPKPEIIIAVSDRFEALSGFRPADDARADIEHLVARTGDRELVRPLVDRLVDDERIGDAFVWLLEADSQATAAVAAIERTLRVHPGVLPYAARIAERYPGDPGIAGALLLHHVVLTPGEALYLPAGNIHAYLDGIGIELMAPSDNVLRGGLTAKHIDVPELASILDREARPVPRLEPVTLDEGGLRYAPEDPAANFSLTLVQEHAAIPLAGAAIALCTDGSFTVRGDESSIDIARGDAILATPDEGELRISGSGSLYLAR